MQKEHTGRKTNYELLRILAMAMVITLHYLGKGGFLTDGKEPFVLPDYLAWFAEAFCVVAVDVYVLISGYFLVDSSFRVSKLLKLWLQIAFYSIGVPAVLFLTGVLPREEIYLERLLTWVFPVLREHYWFATAYVVLYLFAPLLGKAVRNIPKKQLEQILVLALLIFSVSKSLLPVNWPMDTGGYDAVWFLCLFLTAAYIRLYGVPFLEKHGGIIYLSCSMAIFGLMCCYRMIFQRTGRLGDFLTGTYHYNHILCLLSAAALFVFFGKIRITSEKLSKLILRTASCTFGIYLLHENEAVRYLWPKWLGADILQGTPAFLTGVVIAVLALFAAGILVELVRQWIFGHIFQGFSKARS
ncbi:MAG: acyltransferase [Clostridiales bacterium]|nr:acyltransferase [Clostridiales bacterium]